MQIYFSPEVMKNESQLLNVVDQNNKPVGFLTFLFDEKKMFVYGQAEDGVKEDFKDLIKPYIQGMKKTKPDLEIYSYLTIGGSKLEIDTKEEDK